MEISFCLPRQIWFALIGIALVLAFGWVATKSGAFAAIKVLCHMVPTPLQCMARAIESAMHQKGLYE
jgi:hypothetical protein